MIDWGNQVRRLPDLFSPSWWKRALHYRQLTGYLVRNPDLFRVALTHKSYLDHTSEFAANSYERLEFLGDAILDLVVAETLYHVYPDRNEGFLSKKRDQIVNGRLLSRIGEDLGLFNYIAATRGLKRGVGYENQKMLADTLEALIGAIYIDHSYQMARRFVKKIVISRIDFSHLSTHDDNFKSRLLERVQSCGYGDLRYLCVREEGPPHRREYTMQVRIGEKMFGSGQGRNKKEAEQLAALETLKMMDSSSESSD